MNDRISRLSIVAILASVAAGAVFGWASEPSGTPLRALDFARQLHADGWLVASRFEFFKYILWNNLVALAVLYVSTVTTAGGGVPILFFVQATTIGHLARALSAEPNGVVTTLLLTVPHGALELAGFVVLASSILSFVVKLGLHMVLNRNMESSEAARARLIRANGLGVCLLLSAAFIEAYVTPDLCLWAIDRFRLR